jgi:predicted ATP-grasp superfamily ATP-dependent carboligase
VDLRASRAVKRSGLSALVEAAMLEPPGSVVYGASFENHPALVARLASRHTLLGNGPEVLRAVRDPARLGATLRDAGLAFPALDVTRGLRKPLRGGGGTRVRDWRGGQLPPGTYVQERIDGLPCSAVAVADGVNAAVLGITEQLVGERAFGVHGYRWCGNLTPPRLPDPGAVLEQAQAICSCLAAAFALRGVFGVDFIWEGERAWTHEVNPRPTASLELFDGAFEAHLLGCAGELPRPRAVGAGGKAVVFATEDVTVEKLEGVRDVPHPGERIARGRPICTLVSSAATPEAAYADLRAQAARLRVEVPA